MSLSDRYIHLDMLRGLAALAVCIGHIRGFLIVDYSQLESPVKLHMPFYALTSLGHQAVIIFFALSGYLVGGQALKQIWSGKWHVMDYMIRRLTRLWVVLLPALILTFIADMIGMHISGGAGYKGAWYSQFASGPSSQVPIDHSVLAFLGNMAFVQTVFVPVFGSNGPLWSLAYEFWYYIIFPFAAFGLFGKGPKRQRIFLLAIAVISAYFMPPIVLTLGLIWILGALTSLWPSTNFFAETWSKKAIGIFFFILFFICLIFSLSFKGVKMDLILGVSSAFILPFLTSLPPFGKIYNKVAMGLSEISYTLYVAHFPIIAMIAFPWLKGTQFEVMPLGLIYMFIFLMITLIAATAIWWVFERQTYRIRRAVTAKLGFNR